MPESNDTQVMYTLGEIRSDVAQLKQSVDSLSLRLIGNGQPGISQRVALIEDGCTRHLARGRRVFDGVGKIIIGIVIAYAMQLISGRL